MATSLSKIYEIFRLECKDRDIAVLEINQFSDVLFNLLMNSAMLNFPQCKKDLTKVVKDESYAQLLDTDGVTRTFTINSLPSVSGTDMVVEFDGEIKESEYIIEGNSITFDIAPTPFQDVYVRWDVVGEFEEDLTAKEMAILAKGMVLHWLDSQILREDNLVASVGDREIQKTSNANMLSNLTRLKEVLSREHSRHVTRYTYTFSPEKFS